MKTTLKKTPKLYVPGSNCKCLSKGLFTHTSFRTAKRSFPRELQAVFLFFREDNHHFREREVLAVLLPLYTA